MKKSLRKLQIERDKLRAEITEMLLPDDAATLKISNADRAKIAKEKANEVLQIQREILHLTNR